MSEIQNTGVINEVSTSTYKSITKFPINETIAKASTTKMITEDFINETIIESSKAEPITESTI